MNTSTLIESLLSLHASYPGAFTLITSLVKATALLAMAGALVLMLGRRSSRARCWVWRLTLLMLGLLATWVVRPASWREAGLNLSVLERAVLAPASVARSGAAPAGIHYMSTAAPGADDGIRAEVVPVTLATARPAPAGPGRRAFARSLDEQLLAVWALGFVLCAGWKIARGLLGKRWLRKHSQPANDVVQRLCPSGLRCRVSSRVAAPLITGLWHPTIWLPTDAESWSEVKLRAAFQHEHAHHLRHDLWWQGIGTLVACMWWWLPLGWLALRRMQAEAEQAADDVAVGRSLSVADYAEVLVQIARGTAALPSPYQVGVAMSGYSDLEKRVRELLRDNPWRDRLGFATGAAMIFMLAGMSCIVLTGCKRQAPQYVSQAKLVAGGRLVSGQSAGPQYKDYLQDFYGTIIETLESSEMRRRALDRVRALNPELKESAVEVKVTQSEASAIFQIAATSPDPKFTRIFLDALLDEFRALREQAREQQRNQALTALAEDVVKREKAVKDKSAKIQDFQKHNNIIVLGNRQNQMAEMLKAVTLEKNRLLLELTDLDAVVGNIDGAISAKRIGGGAERTSGTDSDTRNAGLMRAELDYLNTRSELAVSEVDLETLLESSKPDPEKVREATQRVARLKKLLAVYSSQVVATLKSRKADIERRLNLLQDKDNEFTSSAIEVGTGLAEHARLTKDYEDSDKAYKEMFDLISKFQVNEDMTGDYITVMERASAPLEVMQPWWRL